MRMVWMRWLALVDLVTDLIAVVMIYLSTWLLAHMIVSL